MLPPDSAAGAARATDDLLTETARFRARSPFGAPLRLSSQGVHWRLGPGRASRDAESKALPPPCSALKPSTRLAGRHAGGDDARTARERLAKPPAGTALAPLSRSHLESVLRRASDAPSTRHTIRVKSCLCTGDYALISRQFSLCRFFSRSGAQQNLRESLRIIIGASLPRMKRPLRAVTLHGRL